MPMIGRSREPDPLLADTAAGIVQIALWTLLERHGGSHLPLASFTMPDTEGPDYIKVTMSSGHDVYVSFSTEEDMQYWRRLANRDRGGQQPRHRARRRH